MGSFSLPNLNVGGGSALMELLGQYLGLLQQERAGRAQTGLGLVNPLIDAELAARRRPISLVDQLLLSREVGSIMPLSQASQEQLGRYRTPSPNRLGALVDNLTSYAQGALPQGRVVNVQRTPTGLNAFVLLQDGTYEIVPVERGGEGMKTYQGRSGPFTLSLDDVGRFLTGQEQTLQRTLAGKSPEEQQRIRDYLSAVGQGQTEREQRLVDLLRKNPGREQQIITYLGRAGGDQPIRLQTGGRLEADPRFNASGGGRIAGPVRIVDRHGRTAATAAENAGESITVTPQTRAGAAERVGAPVGRGEVIDSPILHGPDAVWPRMPPRAGGPLPVPTKVPDVTPDFGDGRGGLPGTVTGARGDGSAIGEALARRDAILGEFYSKVAGEARDVRFRAEELLRVLSRQIGRGEISIDQVIDIARSPGGFEAWVGAETDPTTEAARLLAGSITNDQRLRDPLVRALALGRAPMPQELTARELRILQDAGLADPLASVVGEDLFPQWLRELQALSPVGLSTQAVATPSIVF